MKTGKEILHNRINLREYSRIPHMICSADFNTNYPATNRINRIANEINEYMNWKRKCAEVSK